MADKAEKGATWAALKPVQPYGGRGNFWSLPFRKLPQTPAAALPESLTLSLPVPGFHTSALS